MKCKNLLMILILSTAIALSACGSDTSVISEEIENDTTADTEQESTASVDKGTEIEEGGDVTEEEDTLGWTVLGKLDTYPELRAAFESYFDVTTTDGRKEGILYQNPDTLETEQNATLLMNLRIQDYAVKYAKGVTDEIASTALTSFSDVSTEDNSALAAAVNAYYNLLPDETEGVFRGDAVLTRAEAMALVMRATTPVTESGRPDSDKAFTLAVGNTPYTEYASAVDGFAYLSVADGTLDAENFTSAMTKGEFICLVIKYMLAEYDRYFRIYFEENNLSEYYTDYDSYMERKEEELSSVDFPLVQDAGDISLADALADPENGVPSDMYDTFKYGVIFGIIEEDDVNDWNQEITKTEAITTFLTKVSYFAAIYSADVYSLVGTYEDTRPHEELSWETSAENLIIQEYGSMKNWGNIARENGADGVRDYYWFYKNGSAAGDKPSYLVYMREGSPYYGQVFQYGDTLLDGSINDYGTNDEYYAALNKAAAESWEESGYDVEYHDDGTYTVYINADDFDFSN